MNNLVIRGGRANNTTPAATSFFWHTSRSIDMPSWFIEHSFHLVFLWFTAIVSFSMVRYKWKSVWRTSPMRNNYGSTTVLCFMSCTWFCIPCRLPLFSCVRWKDWGAWERGYIYACEKGSGNIVYNELSQQNAIIAYVAVFTPNLLFELKSYSTFSILPSFIWLFYNLC